MSYNNETKSIILLEIKNGISPIELSKKTRIPVKTIMRWYRKHLNKGPIKDILGQINELIASQKYTKALELCEDPSVYLDNEIFNKRINLLIKLGRLKEALKLCETPYYENDYAILSYKITILTRIGRLKEALEACNSPLATDNSVILSQKITILIKMHELNAALQLCYENEAEESEVITNQKIRVLMELERLEEALAITQNEKYASNSNIKFYQAKILFKLNEDDQALEICNNPLFRNLPQFQNLKREIMLNKNASSTNNNQVTAQLPISITNIANITEEEIKSSTLSEPLRLVFLIAFYEYHNYPEKVILNTLKKALQLYQANKNMVKIINILNNRMRNKKKKIFNIDFYFLILEAVINLERHDLKKMQEALMELTAPRDIKPLEDLIPNENSRK